MCDIIVTQCQERFGYTGHLEAASLLDSSLFVKFRTDSTFLSSTVASIVKYYPFLDSSSLTSELKVIYNRQEFRKCSGALSLLQVLVENNLGEIFSETLKLCKIVITIPMASVESERCFSTLKRIKNFLRNTMGEERLNSLAMLSMEKKLVRDSDTFNKNVIDRFARQKERRANFNYR